MVKYNFFVKYYISFSALTEEEKNEELGVIMVPDHIVLTVDEKERLFEGMFVIFCETKCLRAYDSYCMSHQRADFVV